MRLLDLVRDSVRSLMSKIAQFLNTVSGGKLSPNTITAIGFFAHVPIAYLIATRHPLWAAILLVLFGLFDALDGALARLQKRPTAVGMFLDSSTDRMKEIMLYGGMAVFLLNTPVSNTAIVVLVLALGVSVLITYLNAWGEVVMAHYTKSAKHQVNKTFRSGLLGFDARMVLIILGLVSGKLVAALCIILVLGCVTVFQRFTNVIEHLKHVQD